MSQQKDTDDLSAALSRAIDSDETSVVEEETSALEQSLDSTGRWERMGTGSWEKQESEKKDFDDLKIDFSDELAAEPAVEKAPPKEKVAKKKVAKKKVAKKKVAKEGNVESASEGTSPIEAKPAKKKPAKKKPVEKKPVKKKKAKKKTESSAEAVGAAFAGLSLDLDGDAPAPAAKKKKATKKKKKAKPSLAVDAESASTDVADDEEEVDLSAAFGGGGVKKKVKRKKPSSQKSSAGKSAAAPVSQQAQTPATQEESTPAESASGDADKIIIYDQEEQREEIKKLVLCSLGGSVVGAMAWAGMMYVSFGFGGRLSLIMLAFFSAFGARLGADQVRGRKVRLVAGLAAIFSTILAKFFLVVLLSITFAKFTQNDLMELTDPGAANQQYADDQMEAYQEYMDTGDGGVDQEGFYDEDGEYYDDEEAAQAALEFAKEQSTGLSFFVLFFSLFSIFDIPFMIIAAIVASKLAVDSS